MDKHEALDWFLRRKSMYLDDKCQAAEDIAIKCIMRAIDGDWIMVEDGLPEEHDSIFANLKHLSKHMWSKESDNVNVYVEFPDGTGRVTEGRLQDGKWWTRISPVLNPVVTHWKLLPEPPKEES